jgi:hypothetical protein
MEKKRYFDKTISFTADDNVKRKILYLLGKGELIESITGEKWFEHKYMNTSHLIRCAINHLWRKEVEEENNAIKRSKQNKPVLGNSKE